MWLEYLVFTWLLFQNTSSRTATTNLSSVTWSNYPYSQVGYNDIKPDTKDDERLSAIAEMQQRRRAKKTSSKDRYDESENIPAPAIPDLLSTLPIFQPDVLISTTEVAKDEWRIEPDISKMFPYFVSHYQTSRTALLPVFDTYGYRCNGLISQVYPKQHCQRFVPYRSYDGSCNNLEEEKWGSTGQAYTRLSRTTYDDGKTQPRMYSSEVDDGRRFLLPNPRLVSVTLSQSTPIPHRQANILLPFFGQLIAHDLALTPTFEIDGRQPDCCFLNYDCSRPECFQFSIPRADPFYDFFNVTCHQFSRSAPEQDNLCRKGVREQFSTVTHWLDASFLYGSSVLRNHAIRNFYGGQLAFRDVDTGIYNDQKTVLYKQILPGLLQKQGLHHSTCGSRNPNQGCFLAGDERVNQQPMTSSIHIIWMRYHNWIAGHLAATFQHWTDHRIFEEARKLVIASYQVVIYKEFLPALLGSSVTDHGLYRESGIRLENTGYSYGYSTNLLPNVFNEFTTAAFRLHTLLDEGVPRLLLVTGVADEALLSTQLNNQTLLYEEGSADAIISGMLEEMALAFDPQMTLELQGRLFRGNRPFGLDLMAIDIQRGRDHGLATYNDIREACGYARVKNFAELFQYMAARNVQLLQNLYRDVEDIDLIVGGLSETPVDEEASVGPTFACIITMEFRKKRLGDRFWHENPDQFHPVQLRQLRSVNMAQILCQTTALRHVPRNAFLFASDTNPLIPCSVIDELDLEKFFSWHLRDSSV